MTKNEIAEKYNNLVPVFSKLKEHWTEVTGDHYCFGLNSNRINSIKIFSKEELEDMFDGIETSIKRIESEIIKFKKNEIFKSSETGDVYIQELKKIMKGFTAQKDAETDNLFVGLNNLLQEIGMGDWKFNHGYIWSNSSFHHLSISNKKFKHATIHTTITKVDKTNYKMTINCDTWGNRPIGVDNEQYIQFKGYVTLHENYETINSHLNNDFYNSIILINGINEEIEKYEKKCFDPYTSWIADGHTDEEIEGLKEVELY